MEESLLIKLSSAAGYGARVPFVDGGSLKVIIEQAEIRCRPNTVVAAGNEIQK